PLRPQVRPRSARVGLKAACRKMSRPARPEEPGVAAVGGDGGRLVGRPENDGRSRPPRSRKSPSPAHGGRSSAEGGGARGEGTAHLIEEAERRTQELSALLEVSRVVASSLNLSEVLGAILDQLGSIVEHTGSSVLILKDGELEFVDQRS